MSMHLWEDLDKAQIRSFIVPDSAVSGIDTAEVKVLLRDLKQRGALIAGICARCGRAGSRRNPARCEIDACIRRRLGLRQTGRHCKSECICRFCIGSCKETGASLQAKRICRKPSASGNITNGFNKTGGTNHEKLYEYASGSGGCLRYCIDAAVRQLCASGSRHRLAEGISDRTVINLRQRSGYTL